MSEKRILDRMKSYDSINSEDLAFEKYGSWEEVIYGSVRTSPAMDVLTGLYKE